MGFFSRKNRFDRFFEGYEQRTTYDRDGNEKTRFVYTSDYYSPKMEQKSFIIRKVINAVLLIVMAVLQFYAGISETIPMNHTKMMGIVQCLDILALIVSAVYIVKHIAAPYKMEIHTYKGAHNNFVTAHLICLAVSVCAFLAAIVSTIIFGTGFSGEYILWNVAYLVAPVCMCVIWFLEKKTDYDRLPPENF